MEALYTTYDERLFASKALRGLGLQLTIDECSSSIRFLSKLRMMAEVELKEMRRQHNEETQTNADQE